jgi:diketogulonate reductase-like aldo/keto reductase
MGLAPAVLRAAEENSMRTRPIPATGEALPIIGLGTYDVFDIGDDAGELAMRREIVDLLLDKGGRLIDSSPMYNRSEDVVGDVLAANERRDECFLATKVWTDGESAGKTQMQRSIERMNAGVMDLIQVHNLRDLDVQMDTLREWQSDGRIRYHGITHYTAGALEAMEAAMKRHRPQFIQINYSLGEREADDRLLPLATDMGIAVLINRPYMAGQLFRAVRGQSVPDWAGEYAASWGQFFLKFIAGHDAVSCVIPATSDPRHVIDNLGAGFGPLPDAATRARMVQHIESL